MRRCSVSRQVVTVLFFASLSVLPIFAQSQGDEIGETTVLLDRRVEWGRGFPFFPANSARYFRGVYAASDNGLDTGPDNGIDNEIEVFLVEPGNSGIPSRDQGAPTQPVCDRRRLRTHGSIIEVDPPVETYRVFLGLVGGVEDDALSPDVVAFLCRFSDAFLQSFEFFREAAADRGRRLTFSGGQVPEFPAVVDVPR